MPSVGAAPAGGAGYSHHNHGHHNHGHDHHHGHAAAGSGRALLWSLLLILGYATVEAVAGWRADSMALLGDAGHMLTDAVALAMALLAARLGQRPPSPRHSFGLGRVEVLAAVFNVLLMLGIVSAISVEAVRRLLHPEVVDGPVVIVVATLGLLLNLAIALLLMKDAHSLNQRAALLHVLGDLLGSLAAIVAGIVIVSTGWDPIDPILSLFISALILISSLRLLRETVHVLLEGTPRGLELEAVGKAMAAVAGVDSVHDLHIWAISSERLALSAHLQLRELAGWPEILERERELLAERFGIEHVTLQPELPLHPLRRWAEAPGVGLRKEGA
ncbi:MAG: cation diffusion facilitator family transporter [Acidithiobacillus sp.]|uniref:cation diffusion facilitator family transporter n=1 Tax=Acidithiobacillus sp. TaxID=1872118 RepID=UPI003CFFCC68